MKLGILGGTFDPVHSGHIQIASAALAELGLDYVMLLPDKDPPHKNDITPAKQRYRMCRLAAATVPGLYASALELERAGKTYTVDSLSELRTLLPSASLYYIIGTDTLDVLDSWRDFSRIAQMCTFVVCRRAQRTASEKRMQELSEKYGARFVVLNYIGPDLSSTDIRRCAAQGLPLTGMVPAAVERFIEDKGLYLCPLRTEELLQALHKALKPSRYQHTLGVALTARRLAQRFGINPQHAYLAALLHDCAKYCSPEEMLCLCDEAGIQTDALERQSAALMHAPAGCALAQKEYGVQHRAILQAIRRHTLGDTDMTPLDALIYTADFIEPYRPPFRGIEDVRALAETDLYGAMRLCTLYTHDYVRKKGGQPHPRTLRMLQELGKDVQ